METIIKQKIINVNKKKHFPDFELTKSQNLNISIFYGLYQLLKKYFHL